MSITLNARRGKRVPSQHPNVLRLFTVTICDACGMYSYDVPAQDIQSVTRAASLFLSEGMSVTVEHAT